MFISCVFMGVSFPRFRTLGFGARFQGLDFGSLDLKIQMSWGME